ncbi:hypothetical protein I532_11134 [Brevibacillus borstelensis AK1]|uniref:PepSY domain-containing protein n=1 Tax=Brevibacillus borstelensis AK1 TaxID=1300222 RepID=M8DFJ5_9BACL|nr:hypothetical protein [Brevibacillus borstelensis]EMT52202.1 hypothetical protein I532_11134 [Brevibacillus borstelensis AK1]
MNRYRKHALRLCAGTVITASLLSFPFASPGQASAAKAAAAVTPVPVAISKGIQNVTRLIPELRNGSVVYDGPVDGPGVSGDRVSFIMAGNKDGEPQDQAIFDSQSGNLLVLELKPSGASTHQTGLLTEEVVRSRAAAFLYGLHPFGKSYEARDVTRQDGTRQGGIRQDEMDQDGTFTVRFVRKHNQVALNDSYDCLVTVDATGRIIGFRTLNGALYEPIDHKEMPSPQRVLSMTTAHQRFAESKPLELMYMLPDQAAPVSEAEARQPQARLVYAIKGGIVEGPHTGSAIDAFTGKRMQAPQKKPQMVSLAGKGSYAALKTEAEVKAFAKEIARADVDKWPLSVISKNMENGEQHRIYIWGMFAKDVADQEKPYHLGNFPDDAKGENRYHLLVEVEAKTGKLISMKQNDGTSPRKKNDKSRDLKSALSLIEKLLPAGTRQFRVVDAGNEERSIWLADPVVGGLPVAKSGQTAEEGAYVVEVNPLYGSIRELRTEPYDQVKFPERTQAISEQAALNALLQAYPLELVYVKQQSKREDKPEWKLVYDLSFRQSRAHCFCGPDLRVDTTVYVDALTGKVIVDE